MDGIISALQSASSSDVVEKSLVSLVSYDSCKLDETSISSLVAALDVILSNESLHLPSKLKRRVTRMKENLLLPVGAKEPAVVPIQSVKMVESRGVVEKLVPRPKPIKPVVVKPSGECDIPSYIQALSNSKSVYDLESALNVIVCPTYKEGPHMADLKAVLKSVYLNREITNKLLRRRIVRLLFGVCTDKEFAELKAIFKENEPAVPDKSKLPKVAADTKPKKAVVPVNPNAKSVSVCLAALQVASNPAEIEAAIVDVGADSGGKKKSLAAVLETLVEDAAKVDNAKLRRRIKRLIVTLNECEDEIEAADAVVASDAKKLLSAVQSAANKSTLTMKESLKQFQSAETPALLEEAINGIPWGLQIDNVTDDVIDNVTSLRCIQDIINKCQEKPDIVSNAKIRRRVKRALEMIASELSKCQHIESNESIVNEVSGSSAEVAMEVENEQSFNNTDDNGGVDVFEDVNQTDNNNDDVSDEIDANNRDVNGEEGGHAVPYKKVPHVVFIGQLNFSVTSADLEKLLRSHGISGRIMIRLMQQNEKKKEVAVKTDSDAEDETKNKLASELKKDYAAVVAAKSVSKSRGAAFVEFESNAELYKCLTLHHTMFMGRRINVEKSCGGRNQNARSMKIRRLRTEQGIAFSEEVDNVLKSYASKGQLKMFGMGDRLLNRLYSLTPATVSEIVEELITLKPAEEKQHFLLHGLISKREAPVLGSGQGPQRPTVKRDRDDFDSPPGGGTGRGRGGRGAGGGRGRGGSGRGDNGRGRGGRGRGEGEFNKRPRYEE